MLCKIFLSALIESQHIQVVFLKSKYFLFLLKIRIFKCFSFHVCHSLFFRRNLRKICQIVYHHALHLALKKVSDLFVIRLEGQENNDF